MNDFYKLAFSLGVPIVIEPEWSECKKLRNEGTELWNKGEKLLDERHKKEIHKLWSECNKLRNEGNKLWYEGYKLYHDVVDRYFGLDNVYINWDTGEVTKV